MYNYKSPFYILFHARHEAEIEKCKFINIGLIFFS